jgi:hypothetical protein
VKSSHVRCFWRWPPGHRYEKVVEQRYAFKRCRECGKTATLGARDQHSPTSHWGDSGGG